jgi:hypothetical protein
MSSGVAGQGYLMPINTTSHGGFIKVEIQTPAGNWQDVTLDVLLQGIAGRNLNAGCAEPNPNAILRIQRLRYDGLLVQPGAGCGNGSTSAYDYWPNVLYDTREGAFRDNIATGQNSMYLSGVMHYVELDVNNLRRWLQGAIGLSGNNALNQNGYVVYFSDRRKNRNLGGLETGELGFEDFVNPTSGAGTPNGVLNSARRRSPTGPRCRRWSRRRSCGRIARSSSAARSRSSTAGWATSRCPVSRSRPRTRSTFRATSTPRPPVSWSPTRRPPSSPTR